MLVLGGGGCWLDGILEVAEYAGLWYLLVHGEHALY